MPDEKEKDGLTAGVLKSVAVRRPSKNYDMEPQPAPQSYSKLTKEELLHMAQAALGTTEMTNEIFVTKIQQRFQAVGLDIPSVEVRFENLDVEADVYLGSRALPTLWNSTRNMIERMLVQMHILPSNKTKFPILRGVSGVLKPGRMTLLLGPPGCGKSTLLKALCDKLDPELRSSGSITYNGHGFNEFVAQRTAAYVGQNDNHIGEMTVRETLDFAKRVQGPGFWGDLLPELERLEASAGIKPDPALASFMKNSNTPGLKHYVDTDYVMKVIGLDVCADTVVGNDLLRGISGGQKKRVTSGEQIVGPRNVVFMDEISTGLDSATTFEITKSLGFWAHKLHGTILIALLQPAPETYDLFDDVLLLSEGHVVYHGPREDILAFFESMGFKCPERKGVADFLQEVTSFKDQGQYRINRRLKKEYVPVKAFADGFQQYSLGQQQKAELAVPFDRTKGNPLGLRTQKFGASAMELLVASFDRERLLMKRNSIFYIASTIQLIIMGLVTSTLFFRTTLKQNESDGNFYLGAIFFSLLMMLFNGLSELAMLVQFIPILFRQRDDYFYPSWVYTVPKWLLTIPFSAWSAFVWTTLIYFIIGFTPDAGRFFRFMFFLFLLHQTSIAIFRVIGALARSMTAAFTFGGFALLAILVLGGFVLTKDKIPDYWIWAFWSSPLMYAQQAMATNEFLADRWMKSNPNNPSLSVGVSVLDNRRLFHESKWYWIGVGAMCGYTFLFNVIVAYVLNVFEPVDKQQPVMSEALLKDKELVRTGVGAANVVEKDKTRERARLQQLSAIGQLSALAQPSALSQGSGLGQSSGLGQGSGLTESSMPKHVAEGDEDVGAGMKVLPFKPLALSFHNMNYFVPLPAEMKSESNKSDRLQLLHSVSGCFRPGVLTALVGVSGAGKTTLMDVLADRKTGGTIEGDVRVSGYPKKKETFARIAGYCEQNDIHSPQLTIEESLLYSAWLRLPEAFEDVTGKRVLVDANLRQAFVGEVMDLVELGAIKDAVVGMPGKSGLSTEQRKRLTIAVELVANPSIIFMDEPTSGLDARAAAIVMRTVRNTVNTGRTVVCTIHQPSIDIFESFDELLLMKRGGRVIYTGPLGHHSKILVDYFEAIPGVPKIRDDHNPATWMLEISTPAEEEKLGIDFSDHFQKSQAFQEMEEVIEKSSIPPDGSLDLYFPSVYSRDWKTQFVACWWKWNITYWRTPEYNAVRYFFTTCVALLIGTIFLGLGEKRGTQNDIFNIMGGLYVVSLFLGWNNAASVQPVVFVERPVFYRERAAGMYSALPYSLAQAATEVPYIVVQAVWYALITYALIRFEWTVAKFFWYLLFEFLTLLYFCFYGMMAIAITPNQELASVVSSFFFSWWNLFAGFIIPRKAMPKWWQWFYWVNPVAWTLYGLITSQLGDVNKQIEIYGRTGTQSVKDFLSDYFGYEHDMLGAAVGVHLAFVAFFWLIFAYAIKNLVMQKR